MIGESTGHGGREEDFSPAILGMGCSSAQLVMRPAKGVGAAHQPHARFEPRELAGGVSAASSETRQPLAKRRIQAFDTCGIQLLSSL